MKSIYLLLFLSVLLTGTTCLGQNKNTVIVNGIPWFDDRGNIVNAHGACIVEDNGRYYLFGEWKSDKSNAFPGFSCYSSDDLVNWKFENVVLQVQPNGILGPNRVGERVKVMKCPKTGEYVMFMHADNMEYKDPYIGYATCKTINGNYQLHGPLLYQGKPIKRWDMGTFQDTDGKGYLLIHHGPIYRLSDDYHSVEANLTSWEKNDNFYFTAPRIEGPWTQQGIFCPKGTLTYNSQSTFVFPLKRGNDTIPMFMGDRWSYPHQASAATYMWMPLQVEGTKISIPEYWQAWDIQTLRPVDILKEGKIQLVMQANTCNVPIISSMGAGNKMDPTAFEVADIYKTSVCPLAKVMRRELKKRGIKKLKVVYSKEKAMTPIEDMAISCKSNCICPPETARKCTQRRQVPGSNAFVPSVVGLIIAGEVIKDLTGM